VLVATISQTSAAEDEFTVASFGGSGKKPEPPAVKAGLIRASLTKPAEQCEVLANSHLRLVASS